MCGLRFVFPTRRLRTIFMHLSTHKGKVHPVGHGALFSTLAWLVLKSSKSSLYFCPKFLFFVIILLFRTWHLFICVFGSPLIWSRNFPLGGWSKCAGSIQWWAHMLVFASAYSFFPCHRLKGLVMASSFFSSCHLQYSHHLHMIYLLLKQNWLWVFEVVTFFYESLSLFYISMLFF